MEMERGFSISIRQVSQQKFDQCESASAYGTCISIASVIYVWSIAEYWTRLDYVGGWSKKKREKSNEIECECECE